MKFIETEIAGLYLIKPNKFEDSRGTFIKTFHLETLEKHGLKGDFKEGFFSTSKKDVLRGMHFQTPPHDHEKLVYVPNGSILDVVLDIRKDSPTYGKYVSQTLSAENGYIFYVPTGCAHGFLSLEDNTNVTYMQTTMYADGHDGGLNYDSFGFDWNIKNPIITDKDKELVLFSDFETPFN